MNQVHHHVVETLVQMIIGLPCLDPKQSKSLFEFVLHFHLTAVELKTHTLAALCLMVFHPETYRMPGHDIQPTKTIKLGQVIAKDLLLSSMDYDDVNGDHPYFCGHNCHCHNPGDDFAWFDSLLKW